MDNLEIRKARIDEIQEILEIFEAAKSYMYQCGNLTQWGKEYPGYDLIKEDIERDCFYVGLNNGKISFVFYFYIGEDPTYDIIDYGSWVNDLPYGTIHRIASNGTTKNVFKIVMDYCLTLINNIRIDTHENNHTMLNNLKKYGFKQCGIIYVRDHMERIAFQYYQEN